MYGQEKVLTIITDNVRINKTNSEPSLINPVLSLSSAVLSPEIEKFTVNFLICVFKKTSWAELGLSPG